LFAAVLNARQEMQLCAPPSRSPPSQGVHPHEDWTGSTGSPCRRRRFPAKPVTFLAAVAVVALWGVTGPIFHYSDTWQLVINTGTTIVTFLMVFLIQATQNRDTLALQIKLSELILALEGARNELAAIEQQPEGALKDMAEEIQERAGVPDEALKYQISK
jgi:low affinity Fe/Cu permease